MKTNKPIPPQPEPVLRFSPYAWAKLIYLRDISDNEVGAFGMTPAEDLLYIEDIHLVKQKVSMVTVAFDDEAVADFFDQQVDLGRKPEQFARCWIHTHPGCSPAPSITDEHTFSRVFGTCTWSVMFIVDRSGGTYARLHFGVGPAGDLQLPVQIDYHLPFAGSDPKTWKAEYLNTVRQEAPLSVTPEPAVCGMPLDRDPFGSCDDILEQIDILDPQDRQLLLNELASQSVFWDEESEVFDD